jgi:hypothetical protein
MLPDSPQNTDLAGASCRFYFIDTRLGAKKMTEERFEALDQQRWDAIKRLLCAWISTKVENAGKEAYEELDKAADAFTLAHEAMKSVHH